MKHCILALVGVLVSTLTALTQPDYSTNLKSGILPSAAFLPARNFTEQPHEQARSGNYYVLLLQFEMLPASYEQQAPLWSSGVLMDAYLPERTFLARVPEGVNLEALGVAYYLPYLPAYKLSAALTFAPESEMEEGLLHLRVYPYPSETVDALYQSLLDEGYTDLQIAGRGVQVTVSLFGIITLAENAAIMYVESAPTTPQPESVPGRSLHRANTLSSGPGQGIDGTGVSMAVADDGPVSHEDFRGRITQYATNNLGNHGDMVTGIACGAGNIDPLAVGAAPGATLYLYPIEGYPHVEQAPQHYADYGTVVTVTSYSESPGGEYTYSAYSLDGQAIEYPPLMHVFSAGNNSADAASPIYGNIFNPDGSRHANITGGRKAGKSAIAVGNVYDNDDIRISSSRGPAGDGRIKPDICSHGQGHLSTNTNNNYQLGGGTSAAAPGVGGALATLVQLYRSLHNGNNPDGGLLKAALLNGAEDLGRPGPDYTYGWGRMNLARTAGTLQNNQHFSGTIAHGGQQNHTIVVPANTKQIRVMTYWNDVPGAPMAGKALVNDLDTRLFAPGNQPFSPWALSAFPHADSLLKPAWRGVDHLNNMEQVIIDSPVAGTYTLKVNGYLVPQGPQSYHVVYCFITKDLELTYPIGGEGFVPAETQIIRWDATKAGQTGTFSLSYSTDDMATWLPIASNIAAHLRQYTWTVPNTVSGKVFVRVTRETQTSTSPAAFTIIGQPNFQVQYQSANSATLSWPAVPGATNYTVYALGDKYMTPVGTTSNTSYNVTIGSWQNKWYSVAAGNNQGAAGRRAYAKQYLHTPCDVWVTLTLHFDLYPGETRWEIVNNSGLVVASGGPYTNQAPNSILSIQQCLPAGCYELVMYDSYGDGMCCNRGTGSYLLMNTTGTTLASGAQFSGAQVVPFCVSTTNAPLTVQLVEVQPVRCKGGQDGWVSVQAAGGTGNYNYTWNTGATGPNLINVSSGTYTVTVSDGTSQAQLTVVVSQPALPFIASLASTPVACNNSTPNGTISATVSGGTAPYTYLWSNGATTMSLTGLSAGNYALTVTDNNGCTAVVSTAVQPAAPLSLNLAIVHVNCFGGQTGAISATPGGGTAPYSYSWSNGAHTANITNVAAGVYGLTATDANGCSATASATIQQATPLELQLFPETTSCHGAADGMIFTMVAGGSLPYHYAWSNGNSTTGWLGDLAAGTYALTVTDFTGCLVQKSTAVGQPEQIAIAVIASPAAGGNIGSVSIEVSGGTAPYTYLWSNGATTQNISGLVAGTYTVLVRDAHACTKSATATVTNAQPPSADYCNARGSSTNFEWIDRTQIGSYINQSGNNTGYFLFGTATPVPLSRGTQYALTLTPGYQNNHFNESWRIWMDLNQDGDFYDTGELLFAPALSNTMITGTMTIPATALTGLTRMRISMKYGSPSNPCGVFAYGEVEDYVVLISNSSGVLAAAPENPVDAAAFDPQQEVQPPGGELDEPAIETFQAFPAAAGFDLFPNPAGSFVTCRYTSAVEETARLSVFDFSGKLVHTQAILLYPGGHTWELSLDGLPGGCYRVQLDCAGHTITKQLAVRGQ